MNYHCNKCNQCDTPCKCPEPFLGITESDYRPGVVTYNIDGKTVDWDGRHFVQTLQTDTSLIADIINRLLQFNAERHTDTITARELGSILHLADIGDVDAHKINQGSLLTYKKNNDCAEGCIGTHNVWEAWNALDNQVQSMYLAMGFDQKGNPLSLAPPQNPNRTYLMGWNGKNQVSYISVTEATAPPVNGGQVYYDEDSGQLMYVKGQS